MTWVIIVGFQLVKLIALLAAKDRVPKRIPDTPPKKKNKQADGVALPGVLHVTFWEVSNIAFSGRES